MQVVITVTVIFQNKRFIHAQTSTDRLEEPWTCFGHAKPNPISRETDKVDGSRDGLTFATKCLAPQKEHEPSLELSSKPGKWLRP